VQVIFRQDPGFAGTLKYVLMEGEVDAPEWVFVWNFLYLILTPVAVAVVATMDVHFTLEDEGGNEDRLFRDAN
jgi:hypothetical protein